MVEVVYPYSTSYPVESRTTSSEPLEPSYTYTSDTQSTWYQLMRIADALDRIAAHLEGTHEPVN